MDKYITIADMIIDIAYRLKWNHMCTFGRLDYNKQEIEFKSIMSKLSVDDITRLSELRREVGRLTFL